MPANFGDNYNNRALKDKFDLMPYTGNNKPGFKKCKTCHIRIRTQLNSCPCCNSTLRSWNYRMAHQDQPKIKENIFENDIKVLNDFISTQKIRNDVDLYWHILTERAILRGEFA